jgi:hypothetical protein
MQRLFDGNRFMSSGLAHKRASDCSKFPSQCLTLSSAQAALPPPDICHTPHSRGRRSPLPIPLLHPWLPIPVNSECRNIRNFISQRAGSRNLREFPGTLTSYPMGIHSSSQKVIPELISLRIGRLGFAIFAGGLVWGWGRTPSRTENGSPNRLTPPSTPKRSPYGVAPRSVPGAADGLQGSTRNMCHSPQSCPQFLTPPIPRPPGHLAVGSPPQTLGLGDEVVGGGNSLTLARDPRSGHSHPPAPRLADSRDILFIY